MGIWDVIIKQNVRRERQFGFGENKNDYSTSQFYWWSWSLS
ncbi:hypothetical protein C943_00167 [Mariniradius saccharolyticus AK6]|uniref:Uncharacterized protein n=1 Tax=Mariniradius saccharolyticus AK6 TaxID=1239962 RepID=M7XKN5_9BACT|nr:hypothetical protein C943_00167 [Mariniradius saccharolyticus AK6]